jgi:membrane protease subunit (stomatin/prohibitin family)
MLGVDNYATYKTLDAMGDAAANPSGGMAGAGVGLGAGAAMGNIMAQSMNPVQAQTQQVATIACKKCQHQMPENSKFCPSCGEATSQMKPCIKCQTPLQVGSKFCMSCGEKQEKTCPSCQTAVTGAFCSKCGTKVE